LAGGPKVMFSVFKNINRFAGKSKWLDGLAIFFARTLAYLLVLFLAAVSFYEKNLYLFLVPVLAGIVARLLNEIVHLFYKKERPAHLANANVLIPIPKNYSFPSGHASFFFGISFMLIFYSIPLAVIFIVCSCFIGGARVFCGVHWFRDILAGAFVGVASSFIIYGLLNIII